MFLYYIKTAEKCQAFEVQCQSLFFVSLCPGFGRQGIQIARSSMTSWCHVFICALLYNSKLKEHVWSLLPFQMCQASNSAVIPPFQGIELKIFNLRPEWTYNTSKKGRKHQKKKPSSIQKYLNIWGLLQYYHLYTNDASDYRKSIYKLQRCVLRDSMPG